MGGILLPCRPPAAARPARHGSQASLAADLGPKPCATCSVVTHAKRSSSPEAGAVRCSGGGHLSRSRMYGKTGGEFTRSAYLARSFAAPTPPSRARAAGTARRPVPVQTAPGGRPGIPPKAGRRLSVGTHRFHLADVHLLARRGLPDLVLPGPVLLGLPVFATVVVRGAEDLLGARCRAGHRDDAYEPDRTGPAAGDLATLDAQYPLKSWLGGRITELGQQGLAALDRRVLLFG